ncbi:MAG: Rrf2 family transcriptional regulator [Opitutus sp.]|nr:Rrf2 family transcriptional regulator [Opitutus sp.]
MKLSVKTVYACRVLAQIARLHGTGELAHVEALARVEAVPPNYLAQILSELRDGGLITSRRGKTGGYALARAPGDISLHEIVTLVEGDVLEFGGDARGQSGRRVQRAWQGIRTALIEETKRWTLDQLVSREFEEMYYI